MYLERGIRVPVVMTADTPGTLAWRQREVQQVRAVELRTDCHGQPASHLGADPGRIAATSP